MLADDGVASEGQMRFIRRHESSCAKCVAEHERTVQALIFLKSNIIEPTDEGDLETRILRRWRSERRARTVNYWMPAVAGAMVAGIALLAVVQILSASPSAQQADTRGREALLTPSPDDVVLSDSVDIRSSDVK